MPGLILLASYMKSGNTWLRIMLQALDSAESAVDINALRGTVSATSRAVFEQMAGIESSHLTMAEVAAARPAVARMLFRQAGRPTRLKVHEAYLPAFGSSTPAFPPETVLAVLHLVRDPRDVAVSLANHLGCDLATAVDKMGDADFALAANRLHPSELPHQISDWSRHTLSWLEAPLPVLTLRYEDMLADPVASLAAAARHTGMETTPERLAAATAAASFQRLRAQEDESGFHERPDHMQRFFRRGVAGGWRDELPAPLVQAVEDRHGDMMRRFGYLS